MAAIMDKAEIQQIERESTKKPISDIAEFLQRKLGQKGTAYLSGL